MSSHTSPTAPTPSPILTYVDTVVATYDAVNTEAVYENIEARNVIETNTLKVSFSAELAIFIALSQDDGLGLLDKGLPDATRVSLGNDLLEKNHKLTKSLGVHSITNTPPPLLLKLTPKLLSGPTT